MSSLLVVATMVELPKKVRSANPTLDPAVFSEEFA